MTRLKDADSLIEKLDTFNDRVHGDTHFICGIESAKEIIDNEPTADAIPLIRCKDCRYHDGLNRCEVWDMHKTDANDFCSAAELELET